DLLDGKPSSRSSGTRLFLSLTLNRAVPIDDHLHATSRRMHATAGGSPGWRAARLARPREGWYSDRWARTQLTASSLGRGGVLRPACASAPGGASVFPTFTVRPPGATLE